MIDQLKMLSLSSKHVDGSIIGRLLELIFIFCFSCPNNVQSLFTCSRNDSGCVTLRRLYG